MPKEIAPGLEIETVGDIMNRPKLILGYDTETTGVPLWHDPSDDPRQPHVIQIAMALHDLQGNEVERMCTLVKPGDGAEMSNEAFEAHGISLERAKEEGIEPSAAVDMFLSWADRAFLRVGHNESFDRRLMRIMAARHKGFKWESDQPNFCTLYKSVGILKLPATPAMKAAGMRGFKKPSLGECIQHFFGETLEGAHDAMNDIEATMRVFWHLVREHDIPMIKGIENGAAAPQDSAVSQPGDSPPTLPPADDLSENERVRVGDNNPPDEDVRTPFEALTDEINDLYEEARNWLDGEDITTEGQAEEIGKLRDMLRDVKKRGEAMRVTEKKPYDDLAAAVQARFNPLIKDKTGRVDLALATCNSVLAKYLKAKDDKLRAEAAAAAKRAQEQAAIAQDAAMRAADSQDLSERESAEDAIRNAKDLLRDAKRADNAKSQVQTGGRAIGMKSVWRAELVDPAEALLHYRKAQPAGLKDWMREQAAKDVRGGSRVIPGFKIIEDRVPS